KSIYSYLFIEASTVMRPFLYILAFFAFLIIVYFLHRLSRLNSFRYLLKKSFILALLSKNFLWDKLSMVVSLPVLGLISILGIFNVLNINSLICCLSSFNLEA